MNREVVTQILAVEDSITFNKDSQIFFLDSVDKWMDISTELKNNNKLNFDYLMCITSIDVGEGKLALSYNLHSTEINHSIEFQLIFNEDITIPSVESIWKTADWHEREAFDMMGIKFSNHPNMKRILLPQDWEGHPLRKNYEVADYYHGMLIPKDKTEWE